MKRAIVVQADYRLMSALVDRNTAQLLKVGDEVRVTQNLELEGMGTLPGGERAKVVSVDSGASGYVEIEFDRIIPALHEWRNVLLLAPFDTAEMIDGLALVSCVEAKELTPPVIHKTPHHPRLAMAASIVAAFVLGWFFDPPSMAHAQQVVHVMLDNFYY
jgi:hypothetical protein